MFKSDWVKLFPGGMGTNKLGSAKLCACVEMLTPSAVVIKLPRFLCFEG